MKTFIFWYEPIWGQFSRYSKTIKASCLKQAEIKFFASKEGDNCQQIVEVEAFGQPLHITQKYIK